MNLFHRVTASIVTLISVFATMSCVQQEYEISEENLNLEVTIFEEGAQIPLGSTGEMNMKDMLETFGQSESAEHLNSTGENGEYFYEMSENLDLSECLTESGELTSEPVVRYLDLSSVRETMNFGSSDAALNNARLCVDFDTNIGQASAADLTITPYYGDVPAESVTRRLEIQPSMSMDQMTQTKYWLGSNPDIASEDYIFVDFPVQDFLREIPDMIKISMTAVSDNSAEGKCVTKTDGESEGATDNVPNGYKLYATCDFQVPIELSETSSFNFSYKIEINSDIKNALIDLFAKEGQLVFLGKVTNSFPLNIVLKAELVDKDDTAITTSLADIYIPAGINAPSETDINLSFGQIYSDNYNDISGVRFNFTATGVEGASITPECKLEVDLRVYVPNGVTVDLKDLLN